MSVKSLPIFGNNSLSMLRLHITNATLSQEAMAEGAFELVLRYTPEGAAADGSEEKIGTCFF